jgi:hypothetical protein
MHPDNESQLFLAALRFGAAMMIQPLVFQEAAATGNQALVSSNVLAGSALIFQLCTGFMRIPEHADYKNLLSKKERKKKTHETIIISY